MLDIVILAAGAGTRMHSRLPKVLHPLADKPLLAHVFDTATQLNPRKIHVVYGFGGEQVRAALSSYSVNWVEQTEQLGTGHAVLQAEKLTEGAERVLVLYGDVPLIRVETLQTLLNETPQNAVGLLTACLEDPFGLGRIIRNDRNEIQAIVEQKDASEQQRAIKETNTGIMVFPREFLKQCLNNLSNNNAQREYYLTDCIAMAVANQIAINGIAVKDHTDILGVNDRAQLAVCERHYQDRQLQKLMKQGVTLRDPKRVDIRGNVQIASDVTIDINVILQGEVSIGSGTVIEANCILRDVAIGENCIVKANSVVEESVFHNDVVVGPFARIRPGTQLADHARVGNFVEIKKAIVGVGSKIPHLSYVGDATIGTRVNIGAGTITCNYDGANKHQTIIEDDVFVGSDTQLVAPVTLGAGSTIGAGTTVTKNTNAGTLTLSRSPQKSIEGWLRPQKSGNE